MKKDHQEFGVSIQVGGGFHAFHLAEQLDRNNKLDSIITTYPYSVFNYYRSERIPRSKFKSVPTLLIQQAQSQVPWLSNKNTAEILNYVFDKVARYRIGNPDILVGWPGSSLYGVKHAKKKGITTVIDADNVNFTNSIVNNPEFSELKMPNNPDNFVFQKREIEKEYEKYGINESAVGEKYIRKTLRQYLIADYIVVPTQYVYDAMVALGIEESKLTKVPFGVDTNLFSPTERKTQDDTFKIVYVGQIRLRKGIQYLLEAVSELDYPDIEVQLVGSVHENAEDILDEYESQYEHVGHISQNDLPNYYSNCDVFVFPSVLEGFGMVVPEAMACEAPVITTTHTGGVELIDHGENGFLVPPRDVKSIKEFIQYVYENPDEAERIGINARETVENRTWDEYGKNMVEVYDGFLSSE